MRVWQAVRTAVNRWLQKLAKSNREQFDGAAPDCCRTKSRMQGGKP